MSTQEAELNESVKSNDNLTVKVTNQPHCRVKFEITVHPQAVSTAHEKAIKNINKEISIPGFRKGKAPRHLILERYPNDIRKEWVDLTLQTAFNEAIQLTHIYPLKDGQIKRPVIHECSLEKGAHFTIEFETRPTIPSIDVGHLNLKKTQPSPITDQQREDALEQIQNQYITYEPIKDRGAQPGDFVDLDVDILTQPIKRATNNQRVRLDEKNVPAWIYEKVIGLQAGESAEGETQLESTSPDAPNPSIPFRVTVKEVWQGTIPSIDEALAKKCGLETVEELKKRVENKLEEQKHLDTERQQIQELEKALLDHYSFDLPSSMIETDKQARMTHYLNQLKEEHSEEYFRTNHAQIEEMMEKRTRQALQLFLLLRKYAAENQIEVSNQDMSQELNHQLALIPSGQSQIDIYDRENLHQQVYNLALDRKIKQFLLDKAPFIEG